MMKYSEAAIALLPAWARDHITNQKSVIRQTQIDLRKTRSALAKAELSERNLARDNAALRRHIVQLESMGRQGNVESVPNHKQRS